MLKKLAFFGSEAFFKSTIFKDMMKGNIRIVFYFQMQFLSKNLKLNVYVILRENFSNVVRS